MVAGKRLNKCWLATAALIAGLVLSSPVSAQLVDEDFDAVTGTGGGVFLDGTGFSLISDWDEGVSGESASGQAVGFARVEVSAQGLPGGGVEGSGAGELAFTLKSFDLVDEDFDTVSGLGGGVFLTGDGSTPNVVGNASGWDSGILGETAFCVTRGGAVLNGEGSAQGLVSGGVGGTGAGQLSVSDVILNGGDWYGGMTWSIPGFPGGSGVLANPGFELGGWNVIYQWESWCDTSGSYPSLLIVSSDPQAGGQHIKVWGRASGMQSSGIAQELVAQEGQTWELDCWTQHVSGDNLQGSNRVEMRIDYYDGRGDDPIATTSSVVLDASSPLNTWLDATPIQLTAPAGTVSVRATIEFVNPYGESGAAFIDSTSFQVISGPPAFDLSAFSLTADIKGEIDSGAGESYGQYELRIEDTDGNRLVFESSAPADGQWTTLGGTLDQAVEKNVDDVEASGVFDFDTESIRVVVLFDPDRAPSWGTGGTLTVDNLSLTNERMNGSGYSAGLMWADIPECGVIDPRHLMLSADVKGSTVGGTYEFGLTGYVAIPNVDEDFAVITTDTEVQVAGYEDAGGTLTDWNSELENDEAFFEADTVTITETGGAWVQALTSGGYGDDGACIHLDVHDVWPQEGGYWSAGVVWRDQVLPSTDLSEVTLTAMVKGEWDTGWLEKASYCILKLEDPDGDWIGFQQTYDGTYQSIGGLLSGATASGLSETGNGVFDADTSLSYNVVIVYYGLGEASPGFGNWGGELTIDDVYLSPSPKPNLLEVGSITFSETADGTFQSVGGVLGEGESTWAPRGGQFYPEWGTNVYDWDAGLEGEEAFAGFGWGSLIETASAEGCATCGVGGSGGGMFTVKGIQSPPGWYWAGVQWAGLELDLSDLSQVTFSIDAKGIWDTGSGETPGMVTVRLQDANGVRIAWDSGAVDGSFHTLGGTLDTFTAESGFDVNSPSYSATIIVYGARTPGWGTGATVYFDNVTVADSSGTVLFEDFETVTGPAPGLMEGLDAVAVELKMTNGVYTWDDDASLVIDNLLFSPIPQSQDDDADLDLVDYALFQVCYTGEGGGVASGCESADIDLDGDVDLSDFGIFNKFMTGPE